MWFTIGMMLAMTIVFGAVVFLLRIQRLQWLLALERERIDKELREPLLIDFELIGHGVMVITRDRLATARDCVTEIGGGKYGGCLWHTDTRDDARWTHSMVVAALQSNKNPYKMLGVSEPRLERVLRAGRLGEDRPQPSRRPVREYGPFQIHRGPHHW